MAYSTSLPGQIKTSGQPRSAGNPNQVPVMEMKSYAWEVLPGDLHTDDVVNLLVNEYGRTQGAVRERSPVP